MKRIRNIMIVFLISGIWHGAAWSFVLWGVAHGVLMCVEPLFEKLCKWVRWLITFSFVNLAWVLFRSGSISVALQFLPEIIFFFLYGGSLEACRADGGVLELSGQTVPLACGSGGIDSRLSDVHSFVAACILCVSLHETERL